ncbi:hypothetical protein [Stutzerimonas xanthomarina]|uniref:hypothetical protein n=1 Tax=Stutzerimonas xanthomarina TaxID=271420 RepID=UPI003AA9BA42
MDSQTIIGIIVMLLALTAEAIFNAVLTTRMPRGQRRGDFRYTDQAMNMQLCQLAQQLGQDFDASLLDDRLLVIPRSVR